MLEAGLVIVGSGPGGVAAAESFREHDSDSPVRILTADIDLPYARPPLSKEFLRGETDDVALHPPQWFEENGVELVTGAAVDRIDLAGRVVYVGERPHAFGRLILACGASPTTPPFPGGERALQLRSLADATALRKAAGGADSAVVIGSGFIGCEAAASLAMRGVAVTLVAPGRFPQQKRLGDEAGERLRDLVSAAGARHVGGVAVEEISAAGVRLSDGVTIDCDLVLAATGVAPQSRIAVEAGLQVRDSRIVVGADMATSHPDVYAVGDVALARHAIAGRHLAVEHWQDAADQGTIAGARAAGRDAEWDGVPGFWTTIGEATVKYHAWGDGFRRCRLLERGDGFTVWYDSGDEVVAVLTCNADDDYDLGERLIAERRPAPVPMP
ncbi:NAD(P)/FAD-dependent oxidoreductase [Mycobacterium parmense]|uniref:Pyridine nucleotide-disulfide oxidoreductase n=1 Tax=Mycobacterium parmense TaxID=185642 RepID=A0A7I7YWI9_9MYCO|nr:FAD-dependent oxidoreductase [Mycobacterium parmense]MCV7351187.1 FAD-dependent oxidoreductase [Mycobacterium parmense]ORW60731.1 pyridine nucleotide-disulfide oxidoreductase [Mycobacterium parmense]BBZ45363.1 pyridine nucleotide-disulfide oxidoreductase [Mycobacterium parmense]